jgi:hypothetical protein
MVVLAENGNAALFAHGNAKFSGSGSYVITEVSSTAERPFVGCNLERGSAPH